MKTTLRLISLVLASILLCLALSVPMLAKKVSYDDVKNDATEELKAQLDEFDKIKKELKAQLDAAEDLQATAQEKRTLYITLQTVYADEIKTIEEHLPLIEKEITQVNEDLAVVYAEYDKVYESLQTVVRMTYESQDASYLSLILGASSVSDLFSRLERASALISYNNKLIEDLEERQKKVDAKLADLNAKKAELTETRAELVAKQAELEAWNTENEQALLEIEAELDRLVGEYEDYDDRSDVIKDEFQQMVDALIKKEEERIKSEEEKRKQEEIAAANKKNGYLWPLPTSYKKLSSYFNQKRTINSLGIVNRVHYGIDIPAPRGTSIYAVKAGKVLTAKYGSGYGYYVIIDHGDGITSLYAHCSKLLVSKGDIVARGDVVALVGTTGTSTGNHLHLEIRENGVKKDPLNYVKKP
ncbi:MAG: peptidoglycan DD-metalloendopeptidase family protein [Clostridia bacterium]|nr:peptidoglycan DD-metalloendopeptidase family protein [Clostridia bacterium]